MNLWNKYFVETTPDPDAKPKTGDVKHVKSFIDIAPNAGTASGAATGASNWNNTTTTLTEINSTDLDSARENINKMLQGANLPGIDYYEFTQAKADLESDIPDEAACYKAAFKSLTRAGLNITILNSSAKVYIQRLDEGMQKMQEAVQGVNNTVADKQRQLDALNTQITNLGVQKLNLETEIATTKNKVTGKATAFGQAANESKNKIQAELEKINLYLG